MQIINQAIEENIDSLYDTAGRCVTATDTAAVELLIAETAESGDLLGGMVRNFAESASIELDIALLLANQLDLKTFQATWGEAFLEAAQHTVTRFEDQITECAVEGNSLPFVDPYDWNGVKREDFV
tara:strand:+ start:745 stop:1122 length:378 start_codon:yes stop_codon:yes gene_type:complete